MENMEENQGLKLVNDASRSNDIPNDDEKTRNDDDNNNLVIEDNNKPEDIQVKNDDESIAFKLQFDEILIATKLLENAKSNNNNRHYNSYARTSSLSSLNNRRISEIENSYFAHQKSYSHQSSKYHNNYNHNQAKHKRNNSSVPKLNLNGISNNSYYPTTTSRNIKMNSLSSTPYIGYDAFDELSFDDAFGLKTSLKEFDYKFNNNRNDSDWDSLSNSQGYPPLTPSSIHSSSSSYSPSLSPYYPSTSTKSSYNQHHHWFLDDKEFLAQQLLLEEERKLLEIQQIQLNDAIAVHQLRLKSEASNNNNNFDPLFKFNLIQTPTTPTAPLTPLTPSMPSSLNNNNSRYKLNSFLHHKSSSSSSQSFNHFSSSSSSSSSSPSSSFPSSQSRYYKEPIGTPVRKPSPSNSNNNHKHNVKPISISTASSLSPSTSTSTSTSTSSSSSPSSSSSSFSLFSKSPSLSINTSNINVNVNLSPTTTSSMPVTPTTPHNNNNNSYFNPFASLNILNSRPKTINNNLNNKHHHNLFYNSSVSATIFDEREEDLLLWSDESFNKGFEKPLQLDNNNLKFHRGHHRHSSELIKLLV